MVLRAAWGMAVPPQYFVFAVVGLDPLVLTCPLLFDLLDATCANGVKLPLHHHHFALLLGELAELGLQHPGHHCLQGSL